MEIQTEDREPVAPRTQTVVKKSGTGLSLLAILIALAWVVQVIFLANFVHFQAQIRLTPAKFQGL